MYVAVEIFRVQKQVAKTIKKAITYNNNNIHKEMKGSSYILPRRVIATKDIILMVIILTMNEETKRSKKEGEARLTQDSAVRWNKK